MKNLFYAFLFVNLLANFSYAEWNVQGDPSTIKWTLVSEDENGSRCYLDDSSIRYEQRKIDNIQRTLVQFTSKVNFSDKDWRRGEFSRFMIQEVLIICPFPMTKEAFQKIHEPSVEYKYFAWAVKELESHSGAIFTGRTYFYDESGRLVYGAILDFEEYIKYWHPGDYPSITPGENTVGNAFADRLCR
jgi:hypothetical protein